MRKFLLAFVVLAGCSAQPPPPARLVEGTEVPLMLLTELSAGGSEEGTEVAFMVTKDVKAPDDRVLIPRGAIAYGRVSWSRSAGALSKVVNEPPRLAVSIDRTTAIDDQTIYLQATATGEPYHFSGKNTGARRASEGLAAALDDKSTRKALEQLLGAFEGKRMGDEEIVEGLARKLDLKNTEQLAEGRSVRELEKILEGVADGSVTRVTGAQTTLLIDTITELAGLRVNVGDRIAGIFKGSTIRAYPGTPVTASVAQAISVTTSK